jgi:hypothetical protein
MSENVDERLVAYWVESGRRQRAARTRLAKSSLPLERFEGWALDMIVDALGKDGRSPGELPPVLPAPRDS